MSVYRVTCRKQHRPKSQQEKQHRVAGKSRTLCIDTNCTSVIVVSCIFRGIYHSFNTDFLSHSVSFIRIMAESRKPNKLYATHPKGYGKGSRACRVTGRLGGMGLIRKYGINMKRQVFRERALDMGWSKYN